MLFHKEMLYCLTPLDGDVGQEEPRFLSIIMNCQDWKT